MTTGKLLLLLFFPVPLIRRERIHLITASVRLWKGERVWGNPGHAQAPSTAKTSGRRGTLAARLAANAEVTPVVSISRR